MWVRKAQGGARGGLGEPSLPVFADDAEVVLPFRANVPKSKSSGHKKAGAFLGAPARLLAEAAVAIGTIAAIPLSRD